METYDKLCEKVEETVKGLLEEEGIQRTNIEVYGNLVDIYKDLENIKYWERKVDFMNYGRPGYDSYGRYDGYGRRGYDMKYRGYGHLDRMSDNYGRYEESRESYNNYGNYGAKEDGLKSYKFMLESAVDFFKMLKEEAGSPEEHQMLNEYAQIIMREVSV